MAHKWVKGVLDVEITNDHFCHGVLALLFGRFVRSIDFSGRKLMGSAFKQPESGL
jgi:hypothetical protein